MAVALRRGFKAEADRYAVEFRMELQLQASAPLDMFQLAGHLAIPVTPLSALAEEMDVLNYRHLTGATKSPFSAITIYFGRRRAIVYNDSHAPTRQQSDLAHELSHAVLDHSPSALTNESGGRHYNQVLEDEATCLSGFLLVPKAAAMSVVASGESVEEAAARYKISPAMMRMRLNQSGAQRIFARARAKRLC